MTACLAGEVDSALVDLYLKKYIPWRTIPSRKVGGVMRTVGDHGNSRRHIIRFS